MQFDGFNLHRRDDRWPPVYPRFRSIGTRSRAPITIQTTPRLAGHYQLYGKIGDGSIAVTQPSSPLAPQPPQIGFQTQDATDSTLRNAIR